MEVTNTQPKTAWHRWFRRTNVYIAEYILMLIFVGTLLGILSSLWYAFFGMLANDGAEGRTLAIQAVMLLGSLLVICPAAYWLYSRVTGQEMVEPGVVKSKARTVFLTLWLIGAVVALVAVIASCVSMVMTSIFDLNSSASASQVWVGTFLPSLFVVATLAFGILMVVKHVSRDFVIRNAFVVAGVAVVLLIANIVMVIVRKDYTPPKTENCTISAYSRGDCTYEEYRSQRGNSSTYTPDTRYTYDNPFDL